MHATGWSRGLEVTGGGTGVVSHAGLVPLRQLADRTGLTDGLSAALPSPLGGHDRGRVLSDLACAIADGARVISDFRVMGDQRELLGPVASVPTAWRAHADVRGVVHQPLAVDQPLVRVSHVRDTTGLERHATATTPTCPAAFVPRDRAADPADAPASTPDSTAHVEPEHAPSAPRPLPVRGKPSGYTDRPTATKPVRCMSVGTLQHRGLQHDKVTHDGNSQLADRSRRWWQVLGSVQRRWSRRSDRSSLGGQLDAADLRRFRSTGLGRAIQGWLAASLRPRCPQPTRWLLRPREPFRFPAGPPVAGRPPGSRCAGR